MTMYERRADKVKRYIEEFIFTALKTHDLEYTQTVNYISGVLGVSKNIVEEVIKHYSDAYKLKIIHRITLGDKELNSFVQEMERLTTEIKNNPQPEETEETAQQEEIKKVMD